MKIAICLSGQARTWKKCHDNWKHNLSHLDADIDFFIHFWDYDTMPRQVWTRNSTGNNITFEDVLLGKDAIEEISNVLQPKSATFEPKICNRDDFYEVKNRIAWWTVDQFDSMMKCANLKRNHEINTGEKYDAVIRMRSDLFFSTSIEIPKIPKANTVYVTHPLWDREWGAFRISDIFFFADSMTYDQAASFYDHMPFIDAAHVTGDENKIGYPPELALYYYFKSCGMNILPVWPGIKVMRSVEYIQVKGKLDPYECI